MIIKSIRVRNFRSIRDETLDCDTLTVLVGPNGSGKSSFLRALRLFYDNSPKYSIDDFYNKDESQPISILITYTDLSDDEKAQYSKYVESDQLMVERVLGLPVAKENRRYHGNRLVNPDFDGYRTASGKAELTKEYSKLREGQYSDLPDYTIKDAALDALSIWESEHPERCIRRRDDGSFFGFQEIGLAKLERYTRLVFIPAVREASDDAEEGKNSVLSEITDLIVRSALGEKDQIRDLRVRTQTEYDVLMNPENLQEMGELETTIDSIFKTFIPDVGISIDWKSTKSIEIPMPEASVRFVEDNREYPVSSCGHGYQRALIMTMLQCLEVVKTKSRVQVQREDAIEQIDPSIIICIEEPELYQHPIRQRHLSEILYSLTLGGVEGAFERTQIIYSTHSPLMVDIRRFNNIRRLLKVKVEEEKPAATFVMQTEMEKLARILERVNGVPEGTYNSVTTEARLKAIMTPWMNEGFFANTVVLVEGEEDRALIAGVAEVMKENLESRGISIIPCMGKSNLDRPYAIFHELGIQVYVVWDSDMDERDTRPEDNHRLLRLVDAGQLEDWPQIITDRYACFRKTMMDTFINEVGADVYRSALDSAKNQFSIAKDEHAKKNPHIISEMLSDIWAGGRKSPSIETMVSCIISLR